MNKQRGLSLIGVLLIGAILGFLFLVGLRTVPAVTEYLAIKRAITAVATEAGGESSVTELRRGFDKRANVEDIRTVQGADLDITKVGGKVEIAVQYTRKIPLVANVSLLIDFDAASER